MNEGYDQVTVDNDIALLKVAQPFDLTARVALIGLVTPDDAGAVAGPGAMATVTGWGATIRIPRDRVLSRADRAPRRRTAPRPSSAP